MPGRRRYGATVKALTSLRRRQAKEDEATILARRQARAAAAIAEERARIARELHDVVAHSVSEMTVQASAVRRLLDPGQVREREALRIVEETGRQALTEMRRLLGLIGADDAGLEPQPGLQALERLVEEVRAGGLPVELRVEGAELDLPPGIDLAAYRIVQEALANAAADPDLPATRLLVRYHGAEVELEIASDGDCGCGRLSDGDYLVGMRERVALYGGSLSAGPTGDGGFLVRARLPVAGSLR